MNSLLANLLSSRVGIVTMGSAAASYILTRKTENISFSNARCEGETKSAKNTSLNNETSFLSSSPHKRTTSSTLKSSSPRLLFLGTGSSTGCPRPVCPMIFQGKAIGKDIDSEEDEYFRKLKQTLASNCEVSNLAIQGGDPRSNKNYRNNPSLLISMDNGRKNVIFDVGKTFRESALRWFLYRGIQSLDAIILTHHHMDAAAGLDDVRGFQHWIYNEKSKKREAVAMPIYLAEDCLEVLGQQFPWLLGKKNRQMAEKDKPLVERHVATFDVNVIRPFQPFQVENAGGLSVTPLPVMHGEDLVSLGFAFSVGNTNIVYLSDISRMLPETMDYITNKLPPTDILIVDALHPHSKHPVHYSMKQAIELSRKIQPKRGCYLLGMNCDSFPPHDEINEQLKRKYGDVQMAHDGLVLEL